MKDDNFSLFNNDNIETVWEKLGDINIDDDDNTQQRFYDYPSGTDRMEIWQDIEEHFNVSIGYYLEHGAWQQSHENPDQ
jgi:hypothetical protein